MTTEAARDRALSVLRHAAERAPGNAALWARYVYELRVAGLKARARKAAGAARVAAGQRKMLQDIAEGRSGPVEDIAGMIERGDLAGAWAAGSERLRYFPKDHRLLNLLGVAALSDGDPVRAEPVLRRAVEVEPGNEAARGNLGLALVRQKRAVEAIAVLEEAGSRPGALPAIRVNLASAYQTLRRWEEAERLSAALIREMPGDGEVVAVRCKVLIALGRASEALGLLEPLRGIEGFALHDLVAEALGEVEGPEAGLDYLRDLPMQPREAEVRLVSLMAEWGDLEGAAARARALAESLPDDPDPFWLVGLFSTWKAGDPLIDVMRKGLAAPALAPERRGIFGLALAKALMDVGEDGAAMAALDGGNGQLRLLLDYDVADYEAGPRDGAVRARADLHRRVAAKWLDPVRDHPVAASGGGQPWGRPAGLRPGQQGAAGPGPRDGRGAGRDVGADACAGSGQAGDDRQAAGQFPEHRRSGGVFSAGALCRDAARLPGHGSFDLPVRSWSGGASLCDRS